MTRFSLQVLLLAGTAAAGCSDPTLEEACADYCEAIVATDCDHPTKEECSQQCDGLREQLDGKCIEEYTEALDCASGIDFECSEGQAVSTDGACVDEAFALLKCAGFGDDEDEASSSSP